MALKVAIESAYIAAPGFVPPAGLPAYTINARPAFIQCLQNVPATKVRAIWWVPAHNVDVLAAMIRDVNLYPDAETPGNNQQRATIEIIGNVVDPAIAPTMRIYALYDE